MSGQTKRTAATPLEVLELLHQATLDNSASFGDLYADEAVYEIPFAPAGMPNKIVGGDRIRAFLKASDGASPVRFVGISSVVNHQTVDPEVVISEYDLQAEVVGTDKSFELGNVLVLRVRDGKILTSRSYMNSAVIGEALAGMGQAS